MKQRITALILALLFVFSSLAVACAEKEENNSSGDKIEQIPVIDNTDGTGESEKDSDKEKMTENESESEKDRDSEIESQSEITNDSLTDKESETEKTTEKLTEKNTEKTTEEVTEKDTEGQTNTESYLVFSKAAGVYTKEFDLTLTPTAKGNTIRYTLDCSVPTSSSKKYEKPIRVDFSKYSDVSDIAATVVRCAEFDSQGKRVSAIYTASYILVKDANRFSTSVISLVTDNDNLYGYENGIFIKGKNNNCYLTGKASEREVHIDFLDENGSLILEQEGGMRLMGQGAREAFKHKTLRLFARKDYDDSGKFKLNLYDDYFDINGKKIKKFDSLILRSGSSNTYNAILNTQFVYEFAQTAPNLDTGRYTYTTVLLNGEYYGFMAVLEDYSPDFFAQRYGVTKEEITTLNGGASNGTILWELDDGPERELNEFNTMLKFISNANMNDSKNYEKACTMIDIDNFISYIALECYMENWDWPRNNVRVWRYNTNGYNPTAKNELDGRWRFVLKDLDASFGMCQSDLNLNYFGSILRDFGYLDVNSMFKNLYTNPEFKAKFINYTCDMLATTCEQSRLLEILNTMEMTMSLECDYMLNYYLSDDSPLTYPDSIREWDGYIETMRNFIKKRGTNVYNDLKAEMTGKRLASLALEITDGCSITLNTITDATNGLKIKYFTDTKIPYSVNKIKGYEFESIELTGGTVNSDGTITLTSANTKLTVKYKKVSAPESKTETKPNYDSRLYGAYLINGKLYTKDCFTVKDGKYYIESTKIKSYFSSTSATRSLISKYKQEGKKQIPVEEVISCYSGYSVYKVSGLNATVVHF